MKKKRPAAKEGMPRGKSTEFQKHDQGRAVFIPGDTGQFGESKYFSACTIDIRGRNSVKNVFGWKKCATKGGGFFTTWGKEVSRRWRLKHIQDQWSRSIDLGPRLDVRSLNGLGDQGLWREWSRAGVPANTTTDKLLLLV
jgi:hypothetical protein